MSSSYPRQSNLQAIGTKIDHLWTYKTSSQLNKVKLLCLEFESFYPHSWHFKKKEIRNSRMVFTQHHGSCRYNKADDYCIVCDWLAGEIRVLPGRFYRVCFEDSDIKSPWPEESASICNNLFFKNCIIQTCRSQLGTPVALSLCWTDARRCRPSVNRYWCIELLNRFAKHDCPFFFFFCDRWSEVSY